ncbi:polymer-forming cytoskeletal protein [Paraclostridium bifermentans]|uniref:polymer-forming cytoskeletal protein n=1 Tax=Paraclostridium bifermentans TaxID=1490 RepID=UPI001F210732|nr:polymer-forming cytoskeletal protein [Paraclostridium bifermentans]MCE9675219.1 polymer-forming cytoskeletal protein [Paraclostridium bifermentans]
MNNNITIAGDGYISEGSYDKIKVMGSATSSGNISTDILKVNGDARFSGNVYSKEMKVNGECKIAGSLETKNLKVNGDTVIDGDCKIENLVVNGDLCVFGALECNNVTIRGDLKVNKNLNSICMKVYGDLIVKENIEGEDINIYGRINCEGLLTGENIFIFPKGISKCKEIGATYIEVDKPKNIGFGKVKFSLGYGSMGKLQCDIIEGDSIKIKNTRANQLNGNSIDLISNCDINIIEYNYNLQIGCDCKVGKHIKIG